MTIDIERIATCAGIGSDGDGWYEECIDCLRRTVPPSGIEPMTPPKAIVFFCPSYLEPARKREDAA